MGKMMKVLVFLVAFHLLVHKEVKAELYAPFDFFKFILMWPPSLCGDKKGCTKAPPQDFTIHGLWANNFTGAILRRCYKVPYDDSVMSTDLVQQLNLLWPDNRRGKASKFWKAQWYDHGVCSLVWYEQELYFYLATKLRKKFNNLKSGLISNGIIPGPGMSYNLKKIAAAVQKVTTKVPDFYCNYDKEDNFQLNEIRICHTPGGEIIDCPIDRNSDSCAAHELINFPLSKTI